MLLEWFGTLHCALSRFVNGEPQRNFRGITVIFCVIWLSLSGFHDDSREPHGWSPQASTVHPSSPIRISTVFPLHWARHVVCQQCI